MAKKRETVKKKINFNVIRTNYVFNVFVGHGHEKETLREKLNLFK